MNKGLKSFSKNIQAQGAIEYILLAATVLLVLIAFLAPGGIFHSQVNSTVTQGVDQLEVMVNGFNIIP